MLRSPKVLADLSWAAPWKNQVQHHYSIESCKQLQTSQDRLNIFEKTLFDLLLKIKNTEIFKYFLFQSCLNFLCFGILELVLLTRLQLRTFYVIVFLGSPQPQKGWESLLYSNTTSGNNRFKPTFDANYFMLLCGCENICCVFWPAFGCCVHPTAGQNIFLIISNLF